jgi:hypothetical protein
MANISISNLHVTGTDLFADSESYMHELSNTDLFANGIRGGIGIMHEIGVLTAVDSPFCAIQPPVR